MKNENNNNNKEKEKEFGNGRGRESVNKNKQPKKFTPKKKKLEVVIELYAGHYKKILKLL